MTIEALPIEVATADTLHHLIVTLEPLTETEAAEYATMDPDERSDWDRDRTQFAIECPGVTSACEGWIECVKDHPDDLGEDTDVAHGEEHQFFEFGWAVRTSNCSMLEFPDAVCETGEELAIKLGEGRHPIDFDWDDDSCTLFAVTGEGPK